MIDLRVLDPPELATKLPLGWKGNPSAVAMCHPDPSMALGRVGDPSLGDPNPEDADAWDPRTREPEVWDRRAAAAPARTFAGWGRGGKDAPSLAFLPDGCRGDWVPPWMLAEGLVMRDRRSGVVDAGGDLTPEMESCRVA